MLSKISVGTPPFRNSHTFRECLQILEGDNTHEATFLVLEEFGHTHLLLFLPYAGVHKEFTPGPETLSPKEAPSPKLVSPTWFAVCLLVLSRE